MAREARPSEQDLVRRAVFDCVILLQGATTAREPAALALVEFAGEDSHIFTTGGRMTVPSIAAAVLTAPARLTYNEACPGD